MGGENKNRIDIARVAKYLEKEKGAKGKMGDLKSWVQRNREDERSAKKIMGEQCVSGETN